MVANIPVSDAIDKIKNEDLMTYQMVKSNSSPIVKYEQESDEDCSYVQLDQGEY